MNKNVSDKIDIDIVKERPLHDVLASIHLEIGICHAVSCVQWHLPNLTIFFWSSLTILAILIAIAHRVCVAYSTLKGVELARLEGHAMIDAFADVLFGYWVNIPITIALDCLLAPVVDWCWKCAQMQLEIYCNIRQSPTSWVMFRCAWCLGDHLRDRLGDCLCDLLLVSCKIGVTQEVFLTSRKYHSYIPWYPLEQYFFPVAQVSQLIVFSQFLNSTQESSFLS